MMGKFNVKKLCVKEVKQEYHIKILNKFCNFGQFRRNCRV